MTRTRIFIGIATALAGTTVALFGGGTGTGSQAAAPPSAGDTAVLSRLLVGLAGNDTRRYIAKLERRPRDRNTLLLLGLAYQQRARETGDPRFFTLSERALRMAGSGGLTDTGLAALAVSRHRFAAALPLAREALRANPEDATARGALGDALLNLGRYRRAFAAYDRMAELSPSVASYSRIAHARELIGRPRAAAEALELALTLQVPVREHRAAGLVQLGNVKFNRGDLVGARRAYAAALASFPGYVHAQAGLARAQAAAGDFRHAVPLFRRVVERLPLPQYAIWQGDTLRAAGMAAAARRAYDLVAVIERVQAVNGVRTELQSALFDLDHGLRLRDALARGREAHTRAPSIEADDVLAWGLARNGRCSEALRYSKRALRLGTHDALKFFHRGMIERCLGHGADARKWFRRALAVNPHFSLLWAPAARTFSGISHRTGRRSRANHAGQTGGRREIR
jgi:tetratricopeptide (TPR) repeat protein